MHFIKTLFTQYATAEYFGIDCLGIFQVVINVLNVNINRKVLFQLWTYSLKLKICATLMA